MCTVLSLGLFLHLSDSFMIFIISNLYFSIGASSSDFTGSGLFQPKHIDNMQARPPNIRRKPHGHPPSSRPAGLMTVICQ